MNKLRSALEAADVHLSSWHGPGAVANYLLKKHDMGRHIGTPEPEVVEAIAHAYFGGRFQVFRFGHIEGVYDYDISSAYPHATTLLPSTQGRWEHVETYQGDDAPWTVYRVRWQTDAYAGDLTPLPWRSDTGVIHYPSYGHGWYWATEVAAAKRAFGDVITIEEGWRLYPEEEGVFGWMLDLASERVAAKQKAKEATGEERERWQGIERAYKLALNSVYGKTIQTVGEHRPFLCPMWAGLITAYTRARLMDAAAGSPSDLICFATDGLFVKSPTDIKLGDNLGDWTLEKDKMDIRLELYQSGCYAIYKDGEMLDSRFRGVSRSDVPWDALRALWKKKGCAGTMRVPTKRFIGHRTALQRNKPELQCTWDVTPKDVELSPGTGFPIPGDKWYSALPFIDYTQLSARYRKLPAGETDWERDEDDVQP
jgi:DNA polymerase family B